MFNSSFLKSTGKMLAIGAALLHLISCTSMTTEHTTTQSKQYPYTTVPGDSLHTRIYTLKNGLTVYMSPYHDEPRIYTSIAVRAGSKNDPAETTGLAHYLEHMLFKGTDSIGSLDYAKEHTELEKIIELYEKYRATSDPERRAAIYRDIDSLSNVAAQYTVPNEYDKLLNSIGAKGTNAYTWVEQTVYINDIPSNELDRWLTIEAERFRNPVMRLFHTELETVYEEKNMTMDSDSRKLWEELFEGLFTKHTYGTQTTIGLAEHLKKPSIKNVINYYRSWYVPNNMAICIAGDFDPDETIRMIDQKFSKLEPKAVPEFVPPVEPAIAAPVIKTVTGPEAEELVLGFRFGGADSDDADMLTLIDKILYNQTAGLIDLNLNQQQKVLEGGSMLVLMKDYSTHILSAKPRDGQSLDEVRELLLEQLDLVKKGEFPDWLLQAVINDLKLEDLKALESNRGRSEAFVDAFVWGMDWQRYVNRFARLESITKEQLVEFAKKHYGSNYVAVYKKHGERKSEGKIQKPPITPIKVNRDRSSAFAEQLLSKKSKELKPDFLDFKKDIGYYDLTPEIRLHTVPNRENEMYNLYFLFDTGSNQNRKIDTALDYLSYLGTSRLTPAEFSQELYRLGAEFTVLTADDRVYLKLSGLRENFPQAIALLDELLADAQPDAPALEKLKEGIRKERADDKLAKRKILFEAMVSYGKYGPKSPFTNVLSEEELERLTPEELIAEIKRFMSYRHRVLYYGPDSPEILMKELRTMSHFGQQFQPVPESEPFTELETAKNRVYVVDYDMNQAEIIMLSRGETYDASMVPLITLFNEYYGGGMSSVVFQEMREAKALAYSVFSVYRQPKEKNKHSYIFSYIGTQADKLPEALEGFGELMQKLPESPELFASAKAGIDQKIRTEHITKADILFSLEEMRKLGLNYDIRKDVFREVPGMTFEDIEKFHETRLRNKPHTMLVLGKKNNLDLETLGKYGEVSFLTLEEIFGY
ncbi:peptidase M16 domain protein [Chlorobaculum parvum NCIB 8327]|uniref:Peptidase M16 domain protein n=1 Tax=Chlorobaculum parvum (strain DSM 263 / NCIMB 8327) TaxID=517417 RepID=B3QL45_CHLP8|nr:peptidase M16 domain protein [Chlorobaculum parvum NCIB 8327]